MCVHSGATKRSQRLWLISKANFCGKFSDLDFTIIIESLYASADTAISEQKYSAKEYAWIEEAIPQPDSQNAPFHSKMSIMTVLLKTTVGYMKENLRGDDSFSIKEIQSSAQ